MKRTATNHELKINRRFRRAIPAFAVTAALMASGPASAIAHNELDGSTYDRPDET